MPARSRLLLDASRSHLTAEEAILLTEANYTETCWGERVGA